MQHLLVLLLVFITTSMHGQYAELIINEITSYRNENCQFVEQETERLLVASYYFNLKEETKEISGFRTISYFDNINDKDLDLVDQKNIFDKIDNRLSQFSAERVYLSDDLTTCTYLIKDSFSFTRYVEIFLPLEKDQLGEIIMVRDENSFSESRMDYSVDTLAILSGANLLINPSFEGIPAQGTINRLTGSRTRLPEGWIDCGEHLFPQGTPVDIHSAETNYWGVSHLPSDGETYMGMVTREAGSFELVVQRLYLSLDAGQCYKFKIDLCVPEKYESPTLINISELSSFTNPIVLRFFLGYELCDPLENIFESDLVESNEWQTHSITFKAKEDFTHVVLYSFFETPTLIGYNGSILVDNAKLIKLDDCK